MAKIGKFRKTAGSMLRAVHLIHPGRYLYRKLIGSLKNLTWSIRNRNKKASDNLLFPPPHLCYSVAASYDPHHFFSSGRIGAESIEELLKNNGRQINSFKRILDFGCGCGRILRHWQGTEGAEFFGTDIHPALVKWSSANLGFADFMVNDPKLPLKYLSDSFDLVFAVAVFGHIRKELQAHSINELRRVLKPGGLLLITVKGANRIDELTDKKAKEFKSGELVVVEPESSGSNYCLVYHPHSYVLELTKGMELIYFEPSGSPDTNQDVYLFR